MLNITSALQVLFIVGLLHVKEILKIVLKVIFNGYHCTKLCYKSNPLCQMYATKIYFVFLKFSLLFNISNNSEFWRPLQLPFTPKFFKKFDFAYGNLLFWFIEWSAWCQSFIWSCALKEFFSYPGCVCFYWLCIGYISRVTELF